MLRRVKRGIYLEARRRCRAGEVPVRWRGLIACEATALAVGVDVVAHGRVEVRAEHEDAPVGELTQKIDAGAVAALVVAVHVRAHLGTRIAADGESSRPSPRRSAFRHGSNSAPPTTSSARSAPASPVGA